MISPGAPAPGFQLCDLAGTEHALSGLVANGPILLVFFKISCPTCQLTLPFLERLHTRALPGAPRIIGISQDSAAGTREFNEHFGITFPVLLDPAAARYPASNAYRITTVPSLFLIGAGGVIEWSLNGFHKAELESLGARFGGSPFTANERVPVMRPG